MNLKNFFRKGKIASISIDPNYLKFKLRKVRFKPNSTLEKLIKCYDENDNICQFIPRDFDKKIEIITINPKISVIFSFNKNYVRMSKFQLQQ